MKSVSTPPRPLRFWLQLGWVLALGVFLVLPVVVSSLAGLTVNYQTGLRSGLTLRWVLEVWESYRDTLWRSMAIAVACLIITTLIGVPAAYALSRMPGRLARLLEELLVLPVALPGLATALALIVAWGAVGSFRQSSAFILVGHVLFTLPFMVRSVLAVIHAVDLKTLEEGAASLGAGFLRRFFDVVLPNVRGGVTAGALMTLTLSVGEFNMSWLLHTPLTKTLPVGLADAYASLRLEVASAYTLVFFVMIIPLLLLIQRMGRDARKPS